jgi:hypothetical protein
MMVELKHRPSLALPPRIVGTYSSAFEALASVPGTIISAEEDADHPGCWDVAAARGSVLNIYCIEPAGRG